MNKITQSIVEKVGCPYQVYEEGSSVAELNEAYKQALERGRKEGFTPVFVVSDDVLEEWLGILETSEEEYSVEKTIAGFQGRGEALLQERFQEYFENYSEQEDIQSFQAFIEEAGEEAADALGASHMLTAFDSYSGEGTQETILFEIPVTNPWEVIAYLPMGGWNDCPAADEMMEICAYWYQKYSAVPAVITHDVLEFYVPSPVVGEQAARELAKEHVAFDDDRVYQGTMSSTVDEVAKTLDGSTTWYFWWD